MAQAYNLLMAKQGYATRIEPAKTWKAEDLLPGQVVLQVDRFALTANVVRR
jgi:hypothetical protein